MQQHLFRLNQAQPGDRWQSHQAATIFSLSSSVAVPEEEEAAQERHQQHRQLHHDQQLQQQQLQQQRQHELRREIGRPPAADITPSVPSTITASTAINGDKSSSSSTTTLMSSASPGRGGAPRPLPTPQDISIPPISAPFSRLSTTRPSPSPTGRRVMHADGTMSGGGGGGGAGGGGVGSGGGQRRNVTPPRNHLSMNLAPEDDSEGKMGGKAGGREKVAL